MNLYVYSMLYNFQVYSNRIVLANINVSNKCKLLIFIRKKTLVAEK